MLTPSRAREERALTPARRRIRPGIAAVMALAVFASGCSGGSDDKSVDDNRQEVEERAERKTAQLTFTNPDGSAGLFSRAVFTLTNTESGDSFPVSIDGAGEDTKATVSVEPGTYEITTPEPILARGATYTVRDVEPTTVTLATPSDDEPTPKATVSFGVDVAKLPISVAGTDVTPSSVVLTWEGSDDATSYVVRRTDGATPAASATDGEAIDLADPKAATVTATGLTETTDYTFTVFVVGGESDGASGSASVTTSSWDGSVPAYALAANTVVATDFDSLDAELVDEGIVAVTIDDSTERASVSDVPGVDEADLEGGGCVLGAPFLVSGDVAGDQSFYGIVTDCDRKDDGTTRAQVDTDVPLAAVVPYLSIEGSGETPCYDLSGDEPVENEELCGQGPDTDGDGLSDLDEGRYGTDPNNPDTDGDELTDGEEVNEYGTDPLNIDTDFDLLHDDEITVFGTDPLNPDSDGDGCWDHGENVVKRNPLDASDAGGECYQPDWQTGVEQRRLEANPPSDRPAPSPGLVETEPSSGPANLRGNPTAPGVNPKPFDTIQWAAAAAKPEVECESEGSAVIDVQPYMKAFREKRKFEIEYDSIDWDFDVGIEVGINPQVSVEAKYSCALKLPSFGIQIIASPVPIHLEVEPQLTGEATGKFELSGPKLALRFGITSKGWLDVEPFYVNYPGREKGKFDPKRWKTEPIAQMVYEPATVNLTGELKLAAGARATIGVGTKNSLGALKGGLAFTLNPVVLTLKGSVGTNTCAAASIGAELEVAVRLEAWIVSPDWGLDESWPLWDDDVTYPGASWEIGDCPEDD